MFPLALWNCHLGGSPVVPDKCQPRWSCYGESEVASVLRKLAVRGERLIWQGVPLNWPREHQRVEGKQLRLQSSVDLGSKLCFTTHRIVTLDKSLYFLWASFLHTWKGKRKLTYLSWEFLVAEKLMGTNLNHFKQKKENILQSNLGFLRSWSGEQRSRWEPRQDSTSCLSTSLLSLLIFLLQTLFLYYFIKSPHCSLGVSSQYLDSSHK